MRRLPTVLLCAVALRAQDLALIHARLYPSPDARAIDNATIVIRDGFITGIGAAEIPVPPTIRVIDCAGMTVVAGLWNSHVHFTEPKWREAQGAPAARLEQQLAFMLARHGFTSVFDTGSLTENTLALRERIRKGEVRGPMVLTTGTPLAPANGTPYYLRPDKLPEVPDSVEAEKLVARHIYLGTDGIKIFAGAAVSNEKVVAMPVEIVKAVTAAAHRAALPVFAHPTDTGGLMAAVDGGVDILTHSVEVPGSIDPAVMARMIDRGMALIPTLKLFSGNATLPDILLQVKAYADRGGQILFGTDAGYLTDYDPAVEYQLLSRAGLTFSRVLASLTTAPASRFGYSKRKGSLATGMDGDMVVLGADPAVSLGNFGDVRYTIRGGVVLYQKAAGFK